MMVGQSVLVMTFLNLHLVAIRSAPALPSNAQARQLGSRGRRSRLAVLLRRLRSVCFCSADAVNERRCEPPTPVGPTGSLGDGVPDTAADPDEQTAEDTGAAADAAAAPSATEVAASGCARPAALQCALVAGRACVSRRPCPPRNARGAA